MSQTVLRSGDALVTPELLTSLRRWYPPIIGLTTVFCAEALIYVGTNQREVIFQNIGSLHNHSSITK